MSENKFILLMGCIIGCCSCFIVSMIALSDHITDTKILTAIQAGINPIAAKYALRRTGSEDNLILLSQINTPPKGEGN